LERLCRVLLALGPVRRARDGSCEGQIHRAADEELRDCRIESATAFIGEGDLALALIARMLPADHEAELFEGLEHSAHGGRADTERAADEALEDEATRRRIADR